MSKIFRKCWQEVKVKSNLIMMLRVVLCLLFTLSALQVSALAASYAPSQEDNNILQLKLKKQQLNKNICSACSNDFTDISQELSPRDKFIAETYFSHGYNHPDPDEPLEVLQAHVNGQDLIGAGKIDDAVALFENLVKKFPDARHVNEGLAAALKERFNKQGNLKDLKDSTDAYIKAIKKGIQLNTLPLHAMQVGVDLGKLGEIEKLNSMFQQLDKQFPNNGLIALDYARGLAEANDPKAEEWFKKAIALKNDDAPIEYAEWLLDRQEYSKATDILAPELDPYERNRYLHFLRGYALERLGKNDKARAEYDIARKFYAETPELELREPIKSKYRIAGSELQKGFVFTDLVQPTAPSCTGMTNFRKMIMCEAEGESIGGKRAVGWVARNRVFNGSRNCLYVNNSGSTTCKRYNSVVTQSGQFNYTCGKTPNSSVIQAANDVWDGWAPESSTGWCPSGSDYSGTICTGTCYTSSDQGGLAVGDMAFYSTSGSCASQHPSIWCTASDGKLCGNGGSDHCFYWVP